MASGGSGTSVDVTLKDFSITLAGGDPVAGLTPATVANRGPDLPQPTIEGPGVDNAATPTFGSGEPRR